MQHFLIKRADGSVCDHDRATMTPHAMLKSQNGRQSMQAEIIGHESLDYASVNAMDRYFRNAWTHVVTGRAVGKVVVDMTKAREIHRDVLRRSAQAVA